jgi:DNA gyrase subunit A
MGQKIYNLPDDTYLVSAQGVNDENDVVCITKKGQTIRTHVNGISSQGRNAGGVNVFRMKTDDDYIVAMTVTDYQEDEPEEAENPENIEMSELGTNIEAENTENKEIEKE